MNFYKTNNEDGKPKPTQAPNFYKTKGNTPDPYTSEGVDLKGYGNLIKNKDGLIFADEKSLNDIAYKNQSGLAVTGKALGSIVSGAVLKAGQGVALLGSTLYEAGINAYGNAMTTGAINSFGATGAMLGGLLEKAGYDGEFNLDDATDNPIVKSLFDAEHYIKKNLFEVYQSSDWNEKNFLEQVTDGAWWGNEGADGIAFALSNFIPGALLGKAGLGAKAMNGLADLGEMNSVTRWITKGQAGLLKGAKLAETADRAIQTAFMTSSESLFEAKDTGDNFTQQYLRQYNANNPNATVENIQQLQETNPQAAEDLKAKKGDAMKHTFFANMAALSASNWIEAGMLNKMMGKTGKSVLGAEIKAIDNITDPLERIQRKGLDKFFNNTKVGFTTKTIGKGMITEGLYEENIQHAIQNVSENLALNGKINTMEFIEDVGKGIFTNLGDKEAWKSIGAGMIIGGMFGGATASGIPGIAKGEFTEKEEAITKGIKDLNELSNNLRNVGQIYLKDKDGNFINDEQGNPKVDTKKLQNFIGNLVQAKNTKEIHDYYKTKGETELADIVKNEHVANYVKGFMESGLEDELRTQVKNLKNLSEEDSIQMGFDPIELDERGNKITPSQRQAALETTINDYIKEYKNISKAIPSVERARQGEALSWYARYKHLQGLENRLNERKNLIGLKAESNNSALTLINKLADRHAALTAELPNQEKFSLPKRSQATKKELLLIEKEIGELKLNSLVELDEAGVVMTPGVEKLGDNETPEYREVKNIDRTLIQTINAINDAQDNYNNLMSNEGGKAFYKGLARKVTEIVDSEEQEDFQEGDYVDVTSGSTGVTKSGFISRSEAGTLNFAGVAINEAFLEKNKIVKYTEEQKQALKDRAVETFRQRKLANDIESQIKKIEALKQKVEIQEEEILKEIIDKEDFILNQQNGTVRVTEKQFAKQLKRIEAAITKAEDTLDELNNHLAEANNYLTSLRYMYDTQETIEDVKEIIRVTEEELVETEIEIESMTSIVDKLKNTYYSMLNLWKSLFPSKEYKSLEERALEIEDAIERGVDPATFEEEAIGIANKLADYTDYKQDLQLTGAEMRSAIKALEELVPIKAFLDKKLIDYQNKLKSYELEANKLNYTKVLRPEVSQQENKTNVPTKGKKDVDPFFDKVREVDATIFGTAGNHKSKDGQGLTTDRTQLRWFKFSASYNPEDKNRRLRIVSINDPLYGIGKENDIYKEDAKEYQHENHFKALVVDNEGNPVYEYGDLVFTSLTEHKEDPADYKKSKGKLTVKAVEVLNEQYKSLLEKSRTEPQVVDIIKRSNGTARRGPLISIKKAFGTEEVDLRAAREEKTPINGIAYELEKGLVYAVQNGRPVGLRVRNLNQTERDSAIALLKEYAKNRGTKDADTKVNTNSILNQIKSTFFLGQRVDTPELSIFFLKGEDNLAFGNNIISHEDLISGKFDMQLDQFLSDLNHHVDYSQLNTKKEYRDIHGKKWNTYNEYLVQEREDAPLMSDLVPLSDSIDEPQYVNTYLEFSDGKAKVKAKPTPRKTTTKTTANSGNFASGLDFDSLSSINALQDNQVNSAIDSYDPTNLTIPDDLNTRSIESFFADEPTETKIENKEQIELPGGVKVDADELASFKNTASESMFDLLGQSPADLLAGLAQEQKIGNDDLMGLKNEEETPKPKKGGTASLIDLDLKASRVEETSPINFEEEESWFRKNISSTLPFKKVAGLIDGGNFGRFSSKGEILISEAATRGTGYHEAFHVVSNLYLTANEQAQLHKEWLDNNKNRIEALRKEDHYIGKSDSFIAEEELAEEFREYMLTEESQYKSWFSKLVSFIKGILGLNSKQKEELFSKIKKGVYKDSERLVRPTFELYSRIKGLGATANKELMDGLTVTLFANLARNGFDIQDIRKFNKGELGVENMKKFANVYNEAFDLIIEDIMDFAPAMVNRGMTKADFVKELVKPEMRKAIIVSHAEYLRQFNIQFSLEEETDLQNLPEEEKSKDTLGIIDSIEFSTKNSMPSAVKIAIASLPQIRVNKQGKKELVRSGLGLTKPTDYRRNVAILHNTLANVSSFEDMIKAIQNLSDKIPEMSQLVKKLNQKDMTSNEGFYLQSQFRQQFDKNRHTFYIQLHDTDNKGKASKKTGNSYIIDANSGKMMDIIKASWSGALRRNTETTKTIDGILYLNEAYFKKNYGQLGTDLREETLSFYKDLGITFSNPSEVDIDVLTDTRQAIINKFNDIDIEADLFNQDGIKGYMLRVVEQEVATSLDYSDNQHINPEGKTVYNISLNDFLSINTNDINAKEVPHLEWNEKTAKGNPLVRYSYWLNKVNKQGKRIKTIILEGARVDQIGEVGKSTAKLTTAEVAAMQINNIMMGNFPFLRAGDKSLEKGFTFNESGPKEVEEIRIQEANEIFRKYLAGELLSSYMLNVEQVGADISVYNKAAKGLRLFEGVLNKADQKEADSLMNAKNIDRKEAIKSIDKFIEKPSVKVAIDTYLDNKVKENIALIEKLRIIKTQENEVINLGLPNEITKRFIGDNETLTKGQLYNLMSQFTYHSLIANVEQTKLFTGDVAYFSAFFKRTSGLVGTGKTAWVGEYVDKMLNKLFSRPDKKSNSKIDSIIFNDIASASALYNDYIQAFVDNGYTETEAKELLKDYLNNNEADGQGYMTLPEYREFNLRLGDWSNDREAVYQKAMAEEKLSKEDMQMLSAEKPQMYAPQEHSELYVPTFYKFSIMPLIPSVIKGRNLEKLNKHLLDNAIGMAVFESGNKVGSRNIRPFYDTKGEINNDASISHTFNYKYMKKQLDINPQTKDSVVFGTQFRKLILSGLMNKTLTINGKSVQGTDIIKEYNGLIDNQIKLETLKLIKKLGVTRDGNNYKITKPEVLRDIVVRASKDKNASDNQIEALYSIFKSGEINPAELSVDVNKIEQILMSLVNNALINQKVKGGMLVQGASTGFENKARKQSKVAKEKWESNLETLQFYKSTDGSTMAMEVYLPYKYAELFSTSDVSKIDKRLRELIAFRIPTQGLNSIEAIRVKGFLPREAGDLVIVPTEGVTKSGWDFDVDKLNVFFPNFTTVYDWNRLTVNFLKQNIDYGDKLTIEQREQVKEIIDRANRGEELTEVEQQIKNRFDNFIKASKENYVKEIKYLEYKEGTTDTRAIQNRIIELSRQITLAKENFIPLITPNTTKTLTDLEKELIKLNSALGIDDNQRSKFVDWSYNLGVRATYLLGKEGLGQAALQNVSHVMTQIAKVKMRLTSPVYFNHHGSGNGNTKRQWARYSNNGYELSSAGDSRFSALNATLNDGRTIEEAYQLDVKGYRKQKELFEKEKQSWKDGKGKPPLRKISKEQSWKEYKALWEMWAEENPTLIEDLRIKSNNKTLTDKFASTDISQARALAEILNKNINEENENWVDLGQEKDVNNSKTTIQEIISQTINGFVDVANDPFLKSLNIIPETTDVFFFLTRIGVPIKQAVMFLNQPIIREYLSELEVNNAMFLNKEDVLYKEDLKNSVLNEWQGGDDIDLIDNEEGYKKALTTEKLASYIKDGKQNRAIQRQILEDFIAYKEEGRKLFELVNAVTFDTSTSPTIEGGRTKVEKFMDLVNTGNFQGMDRLYKDTFIGSFANAVETSINVYKDLFITEKIPSIRQAINEVKKDFKNVIGIDLDKTMILIKNDLISHLLQNSKVYGSKLGSYIEAMFINKTSNISRLVAQLRSDPELKDNYLIRELVPILSYTKRDKAVNSDDVNNLKMFSKRLVTEEQNLITDAWRELFEFQTTTQSKNKSEIIQNFASDLMVMAILQSGLNNSPLSFTQFIPNENYYDVASKLISNVVEDNQELATLMLEFREKFYQNNTKSNDIVPSIKTTKKSSDGIKHSSNRPYVKVWNNTKKTWKLYKNTYENDGKNNIFVEINKLGDGFNFKEYSNKVSVLADNNIGATRKVETKRETQKESKDVLTKNKLIAQINDSDFNDKTKQEYIKRVTEAKDSEEVADIVKDLCN